MCIYVLYAVGIVGILITQEPIAATAALAVAEVVAEANEGPLRLCVSGRMKRRIIPNDI